MSVERLDSFLNMLPANFVASRAENILRRADWDVSKALDIYFRENSGSSGKLTTNGARGSARGTLVKPVNKQQLVTAVELSASKKPRVVSNVPLGSFKTTVDITRSIRQVDHQLTKSQLELQFSCFPDAKKANTPFGHCSARFFNMKTSTDLGRLNIDVVKTLGPLISVGLLEVDSVMLDPKCYLTRQKLVKDRLNAGDELSVLISFKVNVLDSNVTMDSSGDKSTYLCECLQKLFEDFLKMSSIGDNEIYGESEDSEINNNTDQEASDEIKPQVDAFNIPSLPLHAFGVTPPKNVFRSELKDYQKQALYWMMCVKENQGHKFKCCTRCNSATCENCDPLVEDLNLEDSENGTLPPMWKEFLTSFGTSIYVNFLECKIQTKRPEAGSNLSGRGGILADEMGLGKTVMALALISMDRVVYTKRKPTLLVLPLTLLEQWHSELLMHIGPSLEVFVYHRSSLTNLQTVTSDQILRGNYDVVITTYQTLLSSSTRAQNPILGVEWRRVILDEAHQIKSLSGRTFSVISGNLKSDSRWCLTATPVLNSIEELWPLLKVIEVWPWRSLSHFKKKISDPIKAMRECSGQPSEV